MTATSTFERASSRRRHRSAGDREREVKRLWWRVLGLTLVFAWVLGCVFGLSLL